MTGVIQNRLAYGVGYNDGKYPTRVNRELSKAYRVWNDMLRRCYDLKAQNRSRNKCYTDCAVSENFKSYSYFYDWCNKQIGFGNKGWHLDKDLLSKGNRVYSEDVCMFLPIEINACIALKPEHELPKGLSRTNRGGIKVRCRIDGVERYLGYYQDYLDAFKVYKLAKESQIKYLAEKYKSQIDPRAYEALMNYQVEITD